MNNVECPKCFRTTKINNADKIREGVEIKLTCPVCWSDLRYVYRTKIEIDGATMEGVSATICIPGRLDPFVDFIEQLEPPTVAGLDDDDGR